MIFPLFECNFHVIFRQFLIKILLSAQKTLPKTSFFITGTFRQRFPVYGFCSVAANIYVIRGKETENRSDAVNSFHNPVGQELFEGRQRFGRRHGAVLLKPHGAGFLHRPGQRRRLPCRPGDDQGFHSGRARPQRSSPFGSPVLMKLQK